MFNSVNVQTFMKGGRLFTVEKEEDGKFVVDIQFFSREGEPDWARVVVRFDSLGDAITAAKYEVG